MKTKEMAEHNLLGKEGEELAQVYLQEHGYTLLHTNWHYRHYELDIVTRKGEELVVVEVKTRSENYLLSPRDAVDAKKIKRIVSAADFYARKFNIDLSIRFDIITVIKSATGSQIEHIDNAFYSPVW